MDLSRSEIFDHQDLFVGSQATEHGQFFVRHDEFWVPEFVLYFAAAAAAVYFAAEWIMIVVSQRASRDHNLAVLIS